MTSKKMPFYLIAALVSSIINGILLYALSIELSSNLYYSTTQYATLYTTCISFFGHGVGGVLMGGSKSNTKKINTVLWVWCGAIVISCVLVFRAFPELMSFISHSSSVLINSAGVKIIIAGLVEMPAFLSGGMVYAAIIGYVREQKEFDIPYVTAASTLGSAIGYLLGIFLPNYIGINSALLLSLVILLVLILCKKWYISVPILVAFIIVSTLLNFDRLIEKTRSSSNSVYSNINAGEVIDYDWSRFQKSEYVLTNNNSRMNLVLNGAMQVMASKDNSLIRNIGYETMYQPDYVRDKRVLIIGSGMGRGAQIAVQNGAKHVDCVDIEPSLADKYDVYKDYVDDIYGDDRVDFYAIDGRAALKKLGNEKYDLIVFEGVINAAAVYSLNITTEGYLCTAEAVRDALNILKDDGIFCDYTISSEKTIKSFNRKYKKISSSYHEEYVYALASDYIGNIKYYVAIAGMSKNSYLLDRLGEGLLEKADDNLEISDYIKRSIADSDVKIISDDRPYPYIESFKDVFFEMVFAAIFVLVGIIVCLANKRKGIAGWNYMQFLLLGGAMMMIELYIINKLNFFLDDSMLSYSIGSAAFLLAFALGNAQSTRMRFTGVKFGLLFCLALASFCVVFNIPVVKNMLIIPLALRIVMVVILISPLAFLCGTFFPRLLIRLVDEKQVSKSMGCIMLLDAFGVGAGFFLFNFISSSLGFNYSLIVIFALYIIEAAICYGRE